MTAAINYAASALAQTLIQPEYAVRVVGLRSCQQIPACYSGTCTVQVHGFYYQFWFNHATGEILLRVEGLGIFEAEYEDDEPTSIGAIAAVVYRLPKPVLQTEPLRHAA
jgi:hypothetical protein